MPNPQFATVTVYNKSTKEKISADIICSEPLTKDHIKKVIGKKEDPSQWMVISKVVLIPKLGLL